MITVGRSRTWLKMRARYSPIMPSSSEFRLIPNRIRTVVVANPDGQSRSAKSYPKI
jgi:hypothetical protein